MKFKIYIQIHNILNKPVANILHWYVVKYTLDNNIKYNKILWFMAEKITTNSCKLVNSIFDRAIANAPSEFWEYYSKFNKKYFS